MGKRNDQLELFETATPRGREARKVVAALKRKRRNAVAFELTDREDVVGFMMPKPANGNEGFSSPVPLGRVRSEACGEQKPASEEEEIIAGTEPR